MKIFEKCLFSHEFKEQQKSYGKYIKDIEKAITDSVEMTRIKGVSVSSFLSGGINSN